jgi:fumarate hydratase class II
MALDVTGRQRAFAAAMRRGQEFGGFAGLTKPDLKAAVDAIDDWIESAQGATAPATGFNSALPQPFRSTATAQQKALLFCWVLMRRVGLLQIEEDIV